MLMKLNPQNGMYVKEGSCLFYLVHRILRSVLLLIHLYIYVCRAQLFLISKRQQKFFGRVNNAVIANSRNI